MPTASYATFWGRNDVSCVIDMKYLVLGLLLASFLVVLTPNASADCAATDVGDAGVVRVVDCESSYEYGTCAEGQDSYNESTRNIRIHHPDGSVWVYNSESCGSSSWMNYMTQDDRMSVCAWSAAASAQVCMDAFGYGYTYDQSSDRECYMYTGYSTPAGSGGEYERMDDTLCQVFLAL